MTKSFWTPEHSHPNASFPQTIATKSEVHNSLEYFCVL